MDEGEKISEKAIEDWTLSDKDKTAIATNWTAKLGSITNALFKKTQSANWAKTSGVCHLKIHQVSIEGAEPSIIYVPFLQASLTQIPKLGNTSQLTTTTTSATSTGWNIFDGAGQFLKITTQEKLVSDLEDLQKPNGWITALSSNGWNKKRAKDLLFFQKLYLKTIDRIKELNNSYTRSTTEKPIWSYGGC